jgi:hypothetical protein
MKQMSYITRWLYSTSHKDIAILYLGFGLISAMVGTGMSVIIRMELSNGNSQFFHGNNQAFNVLVTGHAIAMIFLFVMPVIIGAFGEILFNNILIIYFKQYILYLIKIVYINTSQNYIKYCKAIFIPFIGGNKFTLNKDTGLRPGFRFTRFIHSVDKLNDKYLGPYLAGLIEGDGSIWVSSDISKNRLSPKIDIVFANKDYQLALFLYNKLNIGKLNKRSNSNVIMWNINKIEDTYKLLKLTNGYFRTPKYEAVIRAINWINNYILNNKQKEIKNLTYYNLKVRENIISKINIIDIKPLDESNLWNNSWLTGFTDADGNFSISIYKRKNNKTNIQMSYRLEIRQNYLKSDDKFNNSYFNIMSDISNMFNSNLYSRKRYLNLKKYNSTDISLEQNYKYYYTFIVAVGSINNLELVNKYFNKYPLLSSKYLDYKDWSYLLQNIQLHNNKPSNPECAKLASDIRKNFNKTRIKYNWDHLNNI